MQNLPYDAVIFDMDGTLDSFGGRHFGVSVLCAGQNERSTVAIR